MIWQTSPQNGIKIKRTFYRERSFDHPRPPPKYAKDKEMTFLDILLRTHVIAMVTVKYWVLKGSCFWGRARRPMRSGHSYSRDYLWSITLNIAHIQATGCKQLLQIVVQSMWSLWCHQSQSIFFNLMGGLLWSRPFEWQPFSPKENSDGGVLTPKSRFYWTRNSPIIQGPSRCNIQSIKPKFVSLFRNVNTHIINQ